MKKAIPLHESIEHFNGPFSFLSNFYPAEVHLDGLEYPTVEHAFQAAKSVSLQHRERVQSASTPGKAKRLGRGVKLRHDWEDVKVAIMGDLLRSKFTYHEDLGVKLLATGDAHLVEGNDWGDTFWGVCNGVGENWLGQLLMQVRRELQEDKLELKGG